MSYAYRGKCRLVQVWQQSSFALKSKELDIKHLSLRRCMEATLHSRRAEDILEIMSKNSLEQCTRVKIKADHEPPPQKQLMKCLKIFHVKDSKLAVHEEKRQASKGLLRGL